MLLLFNILISSIFVNFQRAGQHNQISVTKGNYANLLVITDNYSNDSLYAMNI